MGTLSASSHAEGFSLLGEEVGTEGQGCPALGQLPLLIFGYWVYPFLPVI